MNIVGIDLSGPKNFHDTYVVVLQTENTFLKVYRIIPGANDKDILNCITELLKKSDTVIGIDAPLSYNINGGDRCSDKELRKKITASGLRPGSIMPPTMTKMVYLTLRGISVTRFLTSIQTDFTLNILEVHPGSSLALHGAPIDATCKFKSDMSARYQILNWLEQQGLHEIRNVNDPEDHYVAACAAAFGAWKWKKGESVWIYPAEPPFHPFDFVS